MRGAASLLLLLALPMAGCLQPPRLSFEDALTQSDASHDGTKYVVNLRGRLVNAGAQEERWVRLLAAVGSDCLSDPKDWPGFVDLGNIAAGASQPVRATFEQEAPLFKQPTLWWRITHTDVSTQVAKACGPLPVG